MKNEALKQVALIFVLSAAIMVGFGVKEFVLEPKIKEIGKEWVRFDDLGSFILYSYSLDGSVQNIYLRSEEEVNEYRAYLDRIGRFTK